MPLTDTQELCTTTPSAVVDLRFYAGIDWDDLTLTDYTLRALPTGWADADTPAAGWTEITDRVHWNGTLTLERDGNAVKTSLSIRGENYDSDYLGLDKAIVVLDRITVAGSVEYDWGLYYLGIVTAGDVENDYRNGGAWSRQLRGLDCPLGLANAPRVTAGKINIAAGASATSSSDLALAALEVGNGEFVGTTVAIAPGNVTDENLNTVWISQNIPSITGETPAAKNPAGLVIDKVHINPIVGFAGLWWFEVFNNTEDPYEFDDYSYFSNETNHILAFKFSDNHKTLQSRERGIFCSDRAVFDAYTGGAPDAAFVLEAKSWPRRGLGVAWGSLDGSDFELSTTAGHIMKHGGAAGDPEDVVCWNQDGSDPHVANWVGGAINISGLPPGEVLRRYPTGTDTGTAADWRSDPVYEPGGYAEENQVEWVLVDLGATGTTLTDAVAPGATTIPLSDLRNWPVPPTGATFSGIIDADEFTYTGRSTTGLTGVTGVDDAHAKDSLAYPLVDGAIMDGWPCSEIELVRRAGVKSDGSVLPVLDTFRVYVQKTGYYQGSPKTPPDTDWEQDWDVHYFARQGNTERTVTFPMLGATVDIGGGATARQGFRWVRKLLVYVQKMSDDGRAKLNEVRVQLAQTQLNNSGLPDLDGLTSGALAEYLLETGYGLTDGVFSNDNPATTHGLLGSHATAIAPYTTVLEDLARVTGCVARYNRAGGLNWRFDPWWPTGAGTLHLTPTATLGAEHVRGEVTLRYQKPSIVGIVVRARSVDGTRQFTAAFPPGADTAGPTREHTDYVVSSDYDAYALAQALYAKEGLNYAYTNGPQEAQLTIKGVGEWCGVDQWIDLALDDSSGELASIEGTYLLRDQYTTALSAGDVDGTAAEPGPGARDVTDTEDKLTIAGGKLAFAGGKASRPANGDPGIVYPSMARAAGRVLIAKVNYSNLGNQSFIGWSASGTTLGSLLKPTGSYVYARDGESTTDLIVGAALATGTEYQLAVVLRTAGAHYLIKGGAYTEWTLLWVAGLGSTATLYPAILNYNAIFTADDVEAPDELWLPTPAAYDTFTRADGAIGSTETTGPDGQTVAARTWTGATWAVASSVAANTPLSAADYCAVHDGTTVNALIGAKLASYNAATTAGVVARMDAALQNGLVLYQDSGNVKLDKMEGGSLSNIATWASAYASGDRLVLRLEGSAYRAYKVDAAGAPTLLGSGTTTVLSGSRHGLFSTHADNTFDNYSCWPVGAEGQHSALRNLGALSIGGTSSWLTERVTQEFRTVDRQRQWATRLNLRRFVR